MAYEEHVLREFVHSTVSDVSIKKNNPGGVFRPVRRLYQRGERGFGEDIPIVLDRFHIAKVYRKGLINTAKINPPV